MQNLTTRLTSIAAIIGVVGTIGTFYYKAGQYNLRLDQIEQKEFVVNETVDLTDVNQKIYNLEYNLLENISDLEVSLKEEMADIEISATSETSDLYKEIQDGLSSVNTKIESLKSDIAVNKAGIDYLTAKIDELEIRFGNPLQQ